MAAAPGAFKPGIEKIDIADTTSMGDYIDMETGNAIGQTSGITSGQLRAARALLGWSRERAAEECGIGWATLSRHERDEGNPQSATLDAILLCFESNGIRFFRDGDYAGVAIASPDTEAGGEG